jgi:hypothetical protein
MATNTVLYGAGLFDSKPGNLSYDQQLSEVQNSGFTSVILWTLHVHTNGDLYYNDTLIVQNGQYSNPDNPAFGKYVAGLRSQGSSVNQVLFGIGSGGVSDFAAIQGLLSTPAGTQTLMTNFAALQANVPVNGYDLDLEEFPLEDYTQTIITLSLLLNKKFGTYITFCPYCDETFWVNCLSGIYQNNNKTQIVSWMNLQCYDGGTGNDPAQWAAAIKNASSPTGVTNPVQFVIPGYWCYNTSQKSFMGQCPDQIQQTFADLAKSDPGINGGFIWDSSDIFTNQGSGSCSGGSMDCAAYATAINNGINEQVTATTADEVAMN